MEPDDDKTQTHIVLTKGTMVSHYRIIEKIGAGGMGEVYLAEDTELDRQVALKFLPSHLCQDEDCRKRFKREAQAAAKLSHPNIIHVYEVSEYQGRPFFAMEHVEGRSLRDVKSEELDIDRIVGIAIQLCDGLHSAHVAGVTHRDIKPSNIIIDSSGRPKLLDFGLASVKGGEHLTKTGSTLGTVGYMSPEQIEGKETDARSDLFSLGVVLYEMIANKSPFRRDDETATLRAILDDTPEPLARYKSGVPDDLQRIVSKLLEKDPFLRYQSAAGVIPDLKKLSSESTARSDLIEKKRDRWNQYVVPSAVIILLAVLAVWYFVFRDKVPTESNDDNRIMLAVLPFENLGNPEDEYFADGITDEITARLSRVGKLGVIARSSAMRYKGTSKTFQEIGEELNIDYVLQGTIRWQSTGDQSHKVRITPQLVKVADESQIWADIYDDQISELFVVQGKVAAEVVNALDLVLGERERKALQVAPTANLEAYNCYLRGREYWHRFEDRQDLAKGLDILYRAVDLDSTFADAYAYISSIYSFMFWASYDHSDECLEKALETALLAQQYDSLGAYSNWALGYYYYYGERDYTRALHYFEQTLQRLPNSADGWAASGYVKRRMGRWTESLSDQKRALELDPLSSSIRYDVCNTLRYMRRFDEALQVVNRGLDLYPGHAQLLNQKARIQLYGQGDPVRAITTLNIDNTDQVEFGSLFNVEFIRFQAFIFARNYDSALAASYRIRSNAVDPTDTAFGYKAIGQAYFLKGLADESRIWLDSARATIESLWERGFLEAGWTPPTIGPVYAMLGRKDEAIKLAREETEILSLQYDALLGCDRLEDLAITYTIVGEPDLAINLLDSVLSMPSELTVHKLRGYPFYDPLRDHPRFKALIEKYEKKHGT